MSLSAGAAPPPVAGSKSDHNLRLGQITGGMDTSPLVSGVSNDALRTALRVSLHSLGYLADDDSKAAFVVSADMVELDRPGEALDPALLLVPVDLSVTARIHYTVTPAAGGRPVFDDTVATTGSSNGDAFTPPGRVRKASEAAVRLNIVAFLQRLQTDWK